MSLAPGTRLGPYEIVGMIGSGGMGEVWKARDPKLGRDVAIKVLPLEFMAEADRLKRFQQEAKILAALNHPNLVQVHEAGEHEGAPYLVMELLEGETLRAKLVGKSLAPTRAADIAREVALGLAAAHEKGILHRDLKPENLFITKDGRVKILDFGLAKLKASAPIDQESATQTFLSEPGAVVGTSGYMSPEQVQGAVLDARSDLFSLGVVLWEMVTSVRPFQRDSSLETMHAILKDDPPEPEPGLKVPPGMRRILDSCLAKEPAARFHSAHDLAFALENPGTGSGASVAEVVLEAARPRRARWWIAGVAVGAVASPLVAWRLLHLAPLPAADRPPSLVVLPSKVIGPPEFVYLADVVPDTLSTLLGGEQGLEIKVSPSIEQVEKAGGDLARIARAYGVDILVQTTVVAQGERLVLNVKLLQGVDQKFRWSQQFEGSLSTYNDLVRQAAGALSQHLHLGAGVSGASLEEPGVRLALAEGVSHLKHYEKSGLGEAFTRAKSDFLRALEVDPRSAVAAARLGILWRERYIQEKKPEDLAEAEKWVGRSLELDPHCAESWYAACWVAGDQHRLDDGLDFAIRAIHFGPGKARYLVGLANSVTCPGSAAMYLALTQRAQKLEPLGGYADESVIALHRLGRSREAVEVADRELSIHPENPWLQVLRAQILVDLGQLPEAEAVLQRWQGDLLNRVDWIRESEPQARFVIAVAKGDPKAPALGRSLIQRYRTTTRDPYSLGFAATIIGPSLVRIGLRDEALALLQRQLETGNGMDLDWLFGNPEIRKLHGDPRFRPILEGSRQGAEAIVRAFQRAKARGELPADLEPLLGDLQNLIRTLPSAGKGAP